MDLEAGGCDGVVMDLLVANYAIKQSAKPMRILSQGLAEEEYAVGFRLGEEALANAVTNAMKAMVADGTMANIAIKWFGADITVIGK
jgi:polar amino acid transport system substrate-binding protein